MSSALLVWADVISSVDLAFFTLIFVLVAARTIRERRRSDLDVALLFGVMAFLLVLPRVAASLGAPSEVRRVMVTPLVLAVPYLMLRLVDDFAAVPRWAMRAAEATFAGQVVALVFGITVHFAVVATYAAVPIGWSSVAFVREARRASGVTSRRYTAVAVGNAAAVASLLLVAVAMITIPPGTSDLAAAIGVVLQLGVLAAGVSYFVAFATPLWLRRLWRDAELRSFLARAPTLLTIRGTDELVRELTSGASAALGFDGALIGRPVAGSGKLRFVGTGETYEAPADETFGGRAISAGRAIVSLDPVRDVPAQAKLYRERDVKMLIAAPIRIGEETLGVLAARSAHASIFADDDLEMCQLLADQCAVVLKDRALLEERERLAELDQLTRLPHAHVLHRRLEERLTGWSPRFALLLMDLDAFSEVNQTFGHPAGDELLVRVAQRLAEVVPKGGSLSRWGGDQFALLLPESGLAGAEAVAARILASLEGPFVVAHDEIECGMSIGIALFPDHAGDPRGLVAAADIALRIAKRSASTYAVYPVESAPRVVQRAALRSDLRRAIGDGSIRPEYQPLVSMRSGGLVRLEALARWAHPERGTVPPSEFIELAERTGLIRPLTDLIMRRALADAREWRRSLPKVRVAVNLSARMFAEAGLIDRIMGACTDTGCAPDALALEITESVLMSEPEHARQTIMRLRDLGISTEIDDFGTGYSSLAYLQHLPVTGLKIDRQFVAAMSADERSDTIVRATIGLAHELGFEVAAEGIADRRLWDLLAATGCDVGQGYYIGRPMAPEAIRGWLRSWTTEVPAPPAPAVPLPAPNGRRFVLVVDDDAAMVSVIRDVLSEHGYTVATASDGAEALSLVAARRPDAVLLDVHMPIVDGETFARTMRERGIDVPIVVMTAGPSAEQWAERLGTPLHLAKPFPIERLLSVTGRVTGRGSVPLN